MNREQQIEEMAQIICGRSKDDICLIDKTSCDSSCRWARDAESIYNAGYRKVDDENYVGREWHDEQVLILAGEIDELKEQLAEYQPIKNLILENQALKDRIAELEKKIENGTLVELPCKVGDTVYQFDNAGNIYESKIKQLIYDTGHISFDERAIGTSIFLTKAEAEARLKELNNSYKETGEF